MSYQDLWVFQGEGGCCWFWEGCLRLWVFCFVFIFLNKSLILPRQFPHSQTKQQFNDAFYTWQLKARPPPCEYSGWKVLSEPTDPRPTDPLSRLLSLSSCFILSKGHSLCDDIKAKGNTGLERWLSLGSKIWVQSPAPTWNPASSGLCRHQELKRYTDKHTCKNTHRHEEWKLNNIQRGDIPVDRLPGSLIPWLQEAILLQCVPSFNTLCQLSLPRSLESAPISLPALLFLVTHPYLMSRWIGEVTLLVKCLPSICKAPGSTSALRKPDSIRPHALVPGRRKQENLKYAVQVQPGLCAIWPQNKLNKYISKS